LRIAAASVRRRTGQLRIVNRWSSENSALRILVRVEQALAVEGEEKDLGRDSNTCSAGTG
jgi:hypothetical protein